MTDFRPEINRWGCLNRVMILALFMVFGSSPFSSAGQGVIFPPNRFTPEEEGYYQSYVKSGGDLTHTIDYIQFHYFTTAYWLSIHDPRTASAHRDEYLKGIGVLYQTMSKKKHWLRETLPPPEFEKFHVAVQFLDKKLGASDAYIDLDPALHATYKELNSAKLVMDGRPEGTGESRSSGYTAKLMVRPFFLPILYDVSTGQLIISLTVATPLGSATLNFVPNAPSEKAGRGPSLRKIVIGDKARYVVLRPGMHLSFRNDQLRILDLRQEAEMDVITLEPIVSPSGTPRTEPSVAPDFDPKKEVRRAEPVYPTPSQ